MDLQIDREALEKRPGILIIGSPNVGKRTLLSRLMSINLEDDSDSSTGVFAQGWTIDTKYYAADVAVWVAHLCDEVSTSTMPNFDNLAALVMVFDLSELSSLATLKKWVSDNDIQKFDILLCIGNKVDLVPRHPVHDEYKRRVLKAENSFNTSGLDFSECGISESEGSSLLWDDGTPCDVRRSCLEWCMERNIEYVEACSSNTDFDKCLSINGDSQGVERIVGALSAHMWPGMVLKSGNRISTPTLPDRQESEEEESDYEGEYEILSGGSAGNWDDTEEGWISAPGPTQPAEPELVLRYETEAPSPSQSPAPLTPLETNYETEAPSPSQSPAPLTLSKGGENVGAVVHENDESFPDSNDAGRGNHVELEDLEQLMSEIVNMRSNSRLMPDFQRREMAAKLAMRMAAMFGDSSGDEVF